ncbi:S49 family peptidase [Herbaspirillum aquaticum]|uniref:Clp protease ClpP n=1 Tax=Herbaspirillum aquaticum TaxID=568783 RepID=A0A225SLR5_9BURK|nr:S49 family peptidase [Herbaspirillum aquaticum]OWY32016.1 Clp protease ClpP [Herbaspirillum aquaticum]
MKLIEILTSPWAIQPEKLSEIQGIYATHLRGEKIDIEAIEARLNRPLSSEQQDYEIRDNGVAVLSVDGVIAPKANLFTRVSGGASAQLLIKQVESAIADPRVSGLVLAVDSPGGSVLGTPELAATIRELSAEKPIVTVSEGTLASAAYWFGSAANAVYISGPTVNVGSIGVVMTHDYSPRATGGQATEITAGRYKRIASSVAPLTAEGKQYLQDQVDHIYSVFVDAVADHRGVAAEDVVQHMADGRVFIGQQAVDAGLVDGIATVDAIVQQMAADANQFSARRVAQIAAKSNTAAGAGGALGGSTSPTVASAGAAKSHDPIHEENEMPDPVATVLTREALERDHAPLYAQLRTDFMAEGAASERQRILGIEAHSMPGHEALISTLKADGKTTPDQAAAQVLGAEKTKLAAMATNLKGDAPDPVKPTDDPQATSAKKPTHEAIAARAQEIVTAESNAGRRISYAQAAARANNELSAA